MPEKVDNSLDDGKIKVGLHSSGFPSRLIAQFVCGVWVTAAASRLVDISSWSALSEADRYTSYSVAVGAGGILFPLIFLLMLHFCRQPFEKEIVYVKEEGLTLQKICAIFLVLWWGCGAGIGTFEVHWPPALPPFWQGLRAACWPPRDCTLLPPTPPHLTLPIPLPSPRLSSRATATSPSGPASSSPSWASAT
jgi:hypothetical protein